MRPHHSLASLAALVLLALPGLSACGGDDEPADGDSSQGASAPDADPAGEVDPAEEAEEGGTAAGFADCTAITAEEMGAVLGTGTARSEVPPGGAGCNYALDDPRMPSVFVEQFGVDDFAEGFEGARANIANTGVGPVEGTSQSLEGIGDGAEIIVSPGPLGGEALQSIGLVLVGDTIVRATTLQASELDEAAMVEITTGILTLVASKA